MTAMMQGGMPLNARAGFPFYHGPRSLVGWSLPSGTPFSGSQTVKGTTVVNCYDYRKKKKKKKKKKKTLKKTDS
eukprot:NODE_25558_length_583_cov_1.828947.p2 GENE.NODE_25558_length_583_cov_1.828947~~NODE_25558_length_583_cov_1.828947.p2  ORF type:complete len:74 (+),score=23.45 NODE_25558_length_583_cov_1.828947:260-481(+)